ncbi:flagellar assembly protein FlgT [Vibrio sp. SCSIO 43137]|uniref:flagellar assembly protein FlgT n=1 Tax=Vibrio sp. SCSIO 43137 TaxID=3021011 RepID=UPI0023077445|nr:flagellar assembly protein FlgT [Vibrio sp. SCSIO 43137]WCE29006.1 flagellar assembly protein FlgT [Vibrio sp. SCSIO 43137]
MKKQIFSASFVVTTLLFSKLAFAEWFEAKGTASFVASEETARVNALEDALYQGMKFSGADIGSLASLRPFLEQKRSEYQFTNHEVRYIRVVEAEASDGKMELRVQMDIYPSATGCHVGQYKKTFLVGSIDIASPQQAVMGQIYDIGDDFSHIVNRQLEQDSVSFVSVGTTDYQIDKGNPAVLQMIAQDTSAQYIIGGEITDLTATVEKKLLGDDMINRQFALEMQVYDGKTGQEVYNKAYREVAQWPFPKSSQVDTRSARFWASTYGSMLLRVSRNIMLDLESELSCKITLPEVVAVNDSKVTINLGRLHGVKVGDKLQLWHTGSFIDQFGLPRNKVSQSDITLTVSRTYDQESELMVDQPQLAQSIQLGDVMHKNLP